MTKLTLSFCSLCSLCLVVFLSTFTPVNAKESPSALTKAPLCSNQILARPIKNGYTWTLASRLGEFLEMAEKDYGERDKSWTILGTEFTNTGQPRNWHPFGLKKKYIIIQLTDSAATNEKEALFQLSHESVHALLGRSSKGATFFEEALATFFSIKATQKAGIKINRKYIAAAKFRKAYDLGAAVFKAHPDAGKRIAAMRKKGIHPSDLNEKQLLFFFPKITKSTAQELAKSFHPKR